MTLSQPCASCGVAGSCAPHPKAADPPVRGEVRSPPPSVLVLDSVRLGQKCSESGATRLTAPSAMPVPAGHTPW